MNEQDINLEGAIEIELTKKEIDELVSIAEESIIKYDYTTRCRSCGELLKYKKPNRIFTFPIGINLKNEIIYQNYHLCFSCANDIINFINRKLNI